MEQPAPKTLPHSIEAEKSILGSILISREAMEMAAETLRPGDFYLPAHQDIFAMMCELYRENKAVDTVTLTDALDRAGTLKSVGGVTYLTELSLFTPSAANASYYARIVEERSMRRSLIRAGGDIAKEAMAGDDELEKILNEAERRIFDISMKKSTDSLVPIQETLDDCFMRIGELMKLNGALTGITTGFTDLDRMTSGLQNSDLIIIAGRPAMGKTAFALNLVMNAAVKGKKSVAIFNLEMPKEQLVMRMLSSEARVQMQSIKTGTTTEDDILRIVDAMGTMNQTKIYIDDNAGASVMEIRSKCRRLKAQHGLDMVVIDYLQLMQTTGRVENRQQAVSEMSRALKLMARELNVPVLVLSQLGRGPEQRTDHRPVMADLRESGAIEQDADIVMMLYRAAVYEEDADNTTEVILAKHRNGPTGTVYLAWRDDMMRFTDQAPQY
ncbi:MAG: replicative DNA helicase [Clostridia bacterium]|nr:replicative DNA helicase [Clostridia bacterium]